MLFKKSYINTRLQNENCQKLRDKSDTVLKIEQQHLISYSWRSRSDPVIQKNINILQFLQFLAYVYSFNSSGNAVLATS